MSGLVVSAEIELQQFHVTRSFVHGEVDVNCWVMPPQRIGFMHIRSKDCPCSVGYEVVRELCPPQILKPTGSRQYVCACNGHLIE